MRETFNKPRVMERREIKRGLVKLEVTQEPNEHTPFRVPKETFLKESVIDALKIASVELQKFGLEIIVKRGYSPLDNKRKVVEALAKTAFSIIYPHRSHEREKIFSSNEHETGRAVDIGIYDKKTNSCIILLGRLNAFTPKSNVDKTRARQAEIIRRVTQTMEGAGFEIHSNSVEQLQMHFTLIEITSNMVTTFL